MAHVCSLRDRNVIRIFRVNSGIQEKINKHKNLASTVVFSVVFFWGIPHFVLMTKIFVERVKQSVNEQPADMRAWAMFAVIDYDYHNSELCQY